MSPRLLASVVVLASAGLALSACATPHSAAGAADSAAVTLDWPEGARPLEHREAFLNQVVKVGLISLRGGATMPEHASPLPVLLTASSGRGTVKTASEAFLLDGTHAVFLPGGRSHQVIAEEGEVLRIAVVAIKGAGPAVAPHPEH